MSVSFYSAVTYLVTAPVTNPIYNVPFPYLTRTHVYGFVNDEPVAMAATPGQAGRFEWASEGQFRYNGSLSTDDRVWIRRFTRLDQRLADYNDGSVLVESDLNIVTKQLLYLIQEMTDWLEGGRDGNPPPGGPSGGPGDGNLPPSTIDEIIDELLGSQLFLDLIELIELNDINAELIIHNTLGVHESWQQDRTLGGLIGALDEGLLEIDARFTHEVNELIAAGIARVTEITALQARMSGAEADVIQINTAIATLDSATATSLSLLSSRIGTTEADIFTIQTTYASQDYAQALVATEINLAFQPTSLEGYLNATSLIQGMQARADADEASVATIASYIAGSGATVNPDGSINWPSSFGDAGHGSVARSLSTAQSTITLHASQLSTEAAMRTALASAFSPGNAANPTVLVSAIQETWETYADTYSTTAILAQTLQSNRQPIFFRATAPNPYTEPEFAGTPFATSGFPNGSLWNKKVGTLLRPFYWLAGTTTVPSGLDEWHGPFIVGGVTKPGIWVPSRDTNLEAVLGARVDNVVYTAAFEDRVEAEIETKLIATFNTDDFNAVTAISQRMTSMIDGGDGFMYSSWNVRINQYLGDSTPVIAGVGLGMQTDLDNPEGGSSSTFIVMADKFAVIKPPTVGSDPLVGAIDVDDIEVPFVIDSVSGRVMVNGTLVARALRVLDGYVGRLTFTEMNPATMEPVNPTGMRLVLPSGTGGFNASSSASPFPGGSNPQRFLVWGGSGTMNHNNATFYVDTDGNAVFTGEVQADNVSGSMSDVIGVNETFSVVTASGAGVTYLPGTPTLPATLSGKPRKAFAVTSVALFGAGQDAGGATMEMSYETSPGSWSTWITVAEGSISMPIGTTLTLAGGLGLITPGAVRLRIGIFRVDNGGSYQYPSCAHYSGLLTAVR